MNPVVQAPLKVTTNELRKYTDEQLAQHIGYFKSGSPDYMLGELEFRRRMSVPSALRSWTAITISIIAILLSVYPIFFQAHKLC